MRPEDRRLASRGLPSDNKRRSQGTRVFLSCEHLKAKAIRIYHECEGRIGKCVPRIAVWHQEACRVMTNGRLNNFYCA